MTFDVRRHNDRSYHAPQPWTYWEDRANCWCCRWCGAAAGFQIHSRGCDHVAQAAVIRYHDHIIPPQHESLALGMLGLSIGGDYLDEHVDLMLELLWSNEPVRSHADVVRARLKRGG